MSKLIICPNGNKKGRCKEYDVLCDHASAHSKGKDCSMNCLGVKCTPYRASVKKTCGTCGRRYIAQATYCVGCTRNRANKDNWKARGK